MTRRRDTLGHDVDTIGVTKPLPCGVTGTRNQAKTAFSPHLSLLLGARTEGPCMKKTIALVALALLISSAAKAGERAGDAALGALSGAVVLGPIGAVAGAVVGYTAGPRIADSWGMRRRAAARHGRRVARQDVQAPVGDGQPMAANQASAPARAPAYTGPPAQGLD
jgi:hypothetical protein